MRQYASSIGLNSNDEEHANVTSYSTRVERIEKLPGRKRWTLTLRKMDIVPCNQSKIRTDWWTEEFDAVVVASVAESDSPWVPPIPGLKEWAEAFPGRIFHGREYRRPENIRGKVGSINYKKALFDHEAERSRCWRILVWRRYRQRSRAFYERDYEHKGTCFGRRIWGILIASLQTHSPMDLVHEILSRLVPESVTVVPEIEAFSRLGTHGERSVRSASMLLANGSSIGKFDYVRCLIMI